MSTSFVRAVLTLLLVVFGCAIAAASPTPWKTAVSRTQQQRANALFAEGNELFGRQAHGPALEKYRAAVALWDHPMLHFNMAVALIKLERYLEASDALDRALHWGATPFTSELYARAVGYRTLVDSKLGTLAVHCTHDDVRVFVDGTPWFSCPGNAQRRVSPGEHVVVGELAGKVVMSVRVSVSAGQVQREEVTVRTPPPSLGRLEYPAPRWLPWLVAGLGVATAAGGFVMRERAEDDMQQIADELARSCPPACDDVWADRRADAHRRSKLGATLAIAGSAIAVGGLVWVIVNRPRHVALPAIEVVPATDGGVARARWTF